MYIASDWKDYEVIDTGAGRSSNAGAILSCAGRTRRSSGRWPARAPNGGMCTDIITAAPPVAGSGR